MDGCLATHNKYRKQHGVAALSLDERLSRDAQQWAEHLISIGQLQHASSKDFGENLFSQWSSADINTDDACIKAVEKWYSEITNYNFKKPGFHGNAGHFTQVVWKDSKHLGVGVAKRNKNGGTEVIVVARYSPPGNNLRTFAENVLPAN